MIELGIKQRLEVIRMKDFGAYLSEIGQSDVTILLPKKQLPPETKIGDKLEVFVYKDSEDRIIATTKQPKISIDEIDLLPVVQVSNIGAFLDWGLEKDLFLPFKEQTHRVQQGEQVLVTLYVDKSERLAATMKIYRYLSSESPYKKEDYVTGIIYEIKDELGAFVAVDNKFNGMIPVKELFTGFKEGQTIEARVTNVREDGKLDLSAREKAHMQMDVDAIAILKVIDEFDGVLPFNDKVSPEVIKREFNLSKNAFKRAIGRLLKEGKIKINEKTIVKM